MSHDATNWAIKAAQGLGLNATDKLVLWHLADAHNPVYGCFPGQEHVAEQCEIARSTLNRSLDRLEARTLFRRIASIDPVTKRQKPTRYILAFEKGFHPQYVESRVPNPDTENRGPDGENGCEEPVENAETRVPIGHGTDAEPGTLTCNRTFTTPTPSDEASTLDQLISLWDPERRGTLSTAESAFKKLNAMEQERAVALADATRAGLWALGRPVPTLAAYLRDRAFEEFHDAPPIDEGRFVITPDRPEWSGWLGHIRKTSGKKGVDTITRLRQWRPETRFPPAGGLLNGH